MSCSEEIVAKVKKYMEQLNREDKIRHALSRLEKIDMTLDLLQETQVGKAVNQLCRHGTYGEYASSIVTKWKEIARHFGIIKKEIPSSSEDEYRYDSDRDMSHQSPESERESPSPQHYSRSIPRKEIKIKKEQFSPPTCSSSGYSSAAIFDELRSRGKSNVIVKKETDAFSRNLETAASSPKAKRAKLMDYTDIDMNYRPLPTLNSAKTHVPKPAYDVFNPEQMFRPRNDRGKVFAGRKKGSGLTDVPRLYDCCIRVISNNIDAIEDLGNIPYDILQPVLVKCTWKQLEYIEHRNPYLEEDSDELWEKFLKKLHPGGRREFNENYKMAFFRLNKESDERFKALSDRIERTKKREQGDCHKTALIEEAYAPMHVRRKQAKHGTAYGNRALPSASEVSKARKEIFDKGSSKSLAAIPSAIINRFSTVGSKKESSSKPPVVKKGALMVKTLKMLNMKRR